MKVIGLALRICSYAWAAPNTALGLGLGALVVTCGGQASVEAGVAEFRGGHAGRWISRLPWRCRFDAVTLGHVILACDEAGLAALRRHEQAHVRQYERWGVFFLPAYAMSSAWQWLHGRQAHADNHFERSARAEAG